MATITKTSAPTPGPITIDSPYRITVDQYERMIETGILADGDPIELIDGILVAKMSKSPQHRRSNKEILKAFAAILPPGWTWQIESPIRIPDFNEPEPDFAIVVGTDDDYDERHPAPGDVALVIEVAATSLRADRGKKRAAYAGAGIPVYWIVNIKERQIEVCSRPSAKRYRATKAYKVGQLVPVVIDGKRVAEIAVNDILPRRAAASDTE